MKRFNSDASEEFSVHTIPSNRSSIKNVETPKKSRKRVCGIIVNLFLGTAIIVDLFWWHLDYKRIKSENTNWPTKSINTSWTLSNAIHEVNENLFSLTNWRFRKMKIILMQLFPRQLKRTKSKSVLIIIFYQRKIVTRSKW